MTGSRWGRAVVIGGGICGLTAARVLADHFDQVELVEREVLPDGIGPRKGVPQARHVHGLLARGADGLERLFPGLRDELLATGAPLFDHGEKAPTRVWAGAIPPTRVGVSAHAFSRDLLESTLRRRVRALPRVTIRDAAPVDGLHLDPSGTRVAGVVLASRNARSDTAPDIGEADFVVDASGRYSALPDWLGQAGYPRPRVRVVDGGLAYATRVFTAPQQAFFGLQQINKAPDQPRGAYVAGIEGGRWIVTLFGAGGDHPPADEDGWLAFAAALNNRHLDDLIAQGTPLPGVARYRDTQNRRFDYAGLKRWPDRLVALGDAVCAFNPVFGQGMTVAVIEALALGDALARRRAAAGDLTGLARSFQRRIPRLVRIPWLMSTSEDLVWQYHGRRQRLPLHLTMANWYKQRLLYLAVHDPNVFRTFVRVYHMLKSPLAMAAPPVLVKVLARAKSPA